LAAAAAVITGHFGFAAGVKSRERYVPLWALMLAASWLDVIFIVTFATGAETIDDAPGTDGGYGDVIIHADYTHSLVGAILISAATGWIATRWWGRRGGVVIGAVVFSHWVLDLIVHRDDLAILPGNLGDLRVGFGLWESHVASALVEAAILALGAYLYWRAAVAVSRAAGHATTRASAVAGLLLLSGIVTLLTDVFVG
jgi:hypothetical protein